MRRSWRKRVVHHRWLCGLGVRRQHGLARDDQRQDTAAVAVDLAGSRRGDRSAFTDVQLAGRSCRGCRRRVALHDWPCQRLWVVPVVFSEQDHVGCRHGDQQPDWPLGPQLRHRPPHKLYFVGLCRNAVQECHGVFLWLHKQCVVEDFAALVGLGDDDAASVLNWLDGRCNVPRL